MKFAVESLPYHDVDVDVMLDSVARLGFRAVNLWASAPPLAAHIDVTNGDPRSVRTKLTEHGLEAAGVTVYGRSLPEIEAAIDFAGHVGAGRVIFDCEAPFGEFTKDHLPKLLAAASKAGVDICVENHLTVPFTEDFESGGHEGERWEEGVDSFTQIKKLVAEVDHPRLKLCLAPPHLWVMNESILEVVGYLLERDKLGYFYVWDIDRAYQRGVDGLNFGPGDKQLPRFGGTLDHKVLLSSLDRLGYKGFASLKCHGTAGWPLEKVDAEIVRSLAYLTVYGEVRMVSEVR